MKLSVEWIFEDSPHYKIIVVGRKLVFKNVSDRSMARLRYLARKEKVSFRGLIIRAIYRGMKTATRNM